MSTKMSSLTLCGALLLCALAAWKRWRVEVKHEALWLNRVRQGWFKLEIHIQPRPSPAPTRGTVSGKDTEPSAAGSNGRSIS